MPIVESLFVPQPAEGLGEGLVPPAANAPRSPGWEWGRQQGFAEPGVAFRRRLLWPGSGMLREMERPLLGTVRLERRWDASRL